MSWPTRIAQLSGGNTGLIPTPHTDSWAGVVIANGSSFSQNTLEAIRDLERDFVLAGFIQKFVRANARGGNSIVAARAPFIKHAGPDLDTVITSTGTINAWVEADGLGGVGAIVSLGVDPSLWFSGQAMSLGLYLMNDVSSGNRGCLGQFGTVASPDVNAAKIKLNPNQSNVMVLDPWTTGTSARTVSDSSFNSIGGLTKGLNVGSRWGANSAGLFRIGTMRGGGEAEGAATGAISTDPIAFYTQFAVSGFDFVGLDFTPDDVANMNWAVHDYQRRMGRAAVTEGMP